MSRNFGAFAAIRAGLIEAAGPVLRGDGGGPAGAAGARGRVLPPPRAGHLRRRLRRARDARRSAARRGSPRRCSGPPIAGSCSRRCRAAASTSSAATSRARDALVALTEAHSSLIGQLLWIGMRRDEVPYHRRARRHGKSAWTLRKKLAYMLDSSLAFSDLPIRLLFGVGMLALAVADRLRRHRARRAPHGPHRRARATRRRCC